MQLELLYDQTPSSFLDDFRKLVQSHPEVQLAAVQDISSPSSSQATASGTGSPSSSQATASDTGSPSSSQATAPPPAKKSKKGYPARVKHSRSYCTNCYSSNLYFIDPSGYEKDNPPVLDGPNACPHCHLSPCVVARPPSWLRGSCDASLSNISKRFKLYRRFWTLLGKLGVWNHPSYIAYKCTKTSVLDSRDVMPECVLRVSLGKHRDLH